MRLPQTTFEEWQGSPVALVAPLQGPAARYQAPRVVADPYGLLAYLQRLAAPPVPDVLVGRDRPVAPAERAARHWLNTALVARLGQYRWGVLVAEPGVQQMADDAVLLWHHTPWQLWVNWGPSQRVQAPPIEFRAFGLDFVELPHEARLSAPWRTRVALGDDGTVFIASHGRLYMDTFLAEPAQRAFQETVDAGTYRTYDNCPEPNLLTLEHIEEAQRLLNNSAAALLADSYGAMVSGAQVMADGLENLAVAMARTHASLGDMMERELWARALVLAADPGGPPSLRVMMVPTEPGDHDAATCPMCTLGYDANADPDRYSISPDQIETLVDLAKQNEEATFKDLASAFGVPSPLLDELWQGTRKRVGARALAARP